MKALYPVIAATVLFVASSAYAQNAGGGGANGGGGQAGGAAAAGAPAAGDGGGNPNNGNDLNKTPPAMTAAPADVPIVTPAGQAPRQTSPAANLPAH